jgi:hypothetical protein
MTLDKIWQVILDKNPPLKDGGMYITTAKLYKTVSRVYTEGKKSGIAFQDATSDDAMRDFLGGLGGKK